MKQLRLSVQLGAVALIATTGLLSLLHPRIATAGEEQIERRNGAAYLTTTTDSTGAFVSRQVIALHADHTMTTTASNSGGPTSHFTTELGSWKSDGDDRLVGKTIDFDLYPNEDVARLDYSMKVQDNGNSISGIVELTIFPLQDNPFDGGGTVISTFPFTGVLIRP